MSILLLNKVTLLSFSFVRMSHCSLSVSLQGALFSVPFKHCYCSLHTENVANSQCSLLGVFCLSVHTTTISTIYLVWDKIVHIGCFHHSIELVSKDRAVEKAEKLKVIKISSSFSSHGESSKHCLGRCWSR